MILTLFLNNTYTVYIVQGDAPRMPCLYRSFSAKEPYN